MASGNGSLSFGLLEYAGRSWSNVGVLQQHAYVNEKERLFTYTFGITQKKVGCVRPFIAPGKGGEIKLRAWSVTKNQPSSK